MSKRADFRLSDEKAAEIETAIQKEKRPEVRQRATAIQMLHGGHEAAEVASTLGVSKPSVYGWVRRWRAKGIDGLANRPLNPPKRKASEAYCQALEAALEQEPVAFGYTFPVWTTMRLRDHLELHTGIRLSVNWLNEVIRQQGYEYRRPRGCSKTISGFWMKQS